MDDCPACGAGWKAIDVSHGPGCPRNLVEEAMETPNGILVRRCFRLLNAKDMGLVITLADITEEEFRAMELIETERQEHARAEEQWRAKLPRAAAPEVIAAVAIISGYAATHPVQP